MRIAVWHNLPSGGGSQALFNHVRGLLARGHTLEAWCPPTADRSFAPLSSLIPEHVVPLDMPQHTRMTDKLQVTLKVKRELAAMEAHCRACAASIDQGGFDLVFANTCMFFRMTPIGRFTALPAVLYLQEPYRWLYEALPALRWLSPPRVEQPSWHPARLRPWFTSWREVRNSRVQARHEVDDAAAYAAILVNSRFSRESVIRAYGREAQVCYLGIDTEWFHDRGEPHERFVIGLGSVTPEKGIDLAIHAVAAMRPPRPCLVWVGNVALPDYRSAVVAMAASLGVELDLHVGVGPSELVGLLNRAAALVYAPRLEPFGLVPLEANACGLPVVAVAEGGVRETVQDGINGLLVDRDAGAVAAALSRVLDDAGLAARLRRSGRETVESQWGLDGATDRLEQAFSRVLARSAAPAREQPVPEQRSAAL